MNKKNVLTYNKKANLTIFSILLAILLFFVYITIIHINSHSDNPIKINFQNNNQLAVSNNKLIFGSNIDMSELLPTSPYYITNSNGEDLIDISHSLGINMFRISSDLTSFPNQNPDAIYTQAQWNTVLNKMKAEGIKAEIIAETHSLDKNVYNDEISSDYMNLFNKYIIESSVGDNSDVYAIDMYNEPTLDSHNLTMLAEERDMIKKRYPNMLVTVGGWKVETNQSGPDGKPVYRWNDPRDAKLLENIVDFYSPHIYGFDVEEQNQFPNPNNVITSYLNALENDTDNKSILINEFGAANGDSVSDQQTIGNKELQANVYYSMYQTLESGKYKNILGSISYVLYSRNQFPDAWSIVKNKGDYIYPAGYVLQQFSLGKNDKNLQFPYSNVPNDVVLDNSDFKKTISAQKGDYVVISLSINNNNQYLLSLPNDTFNVVQNFTFNNQFKKYFAILQAVRSGFVTIQVDQIPECRIKHLCTQAPYYIYTTNLNIH